MYSRYIDDVALSAKRRLEPKDLQPAIRQVYGMFARKDVKPN